MSDNNNLQPLTYYREAEKAVITACIMNGEGAISQAVSSGLKPEAFSPQNRILYEALIEMYEASLPVDGVTLGVHLQRTGKLEAVGGHAGIAAYVSGMPLFSDLTPYIQIIQDAYLRRRLVVHTHKLLSSAWDDTGEDVRSDVERTIAELAVYADRTESPLLNFKAMSGSMLEELETRQKSGTMIQGLRTGFIDLDVLTGGLLPGQLITLAARPKQGKSAFAGNLAVNLCHLNNAAGLFFPLEMGTREVMHRCVTAQARITGDRYKAGQLNGAEWKQVGQAMDFLGGLDLHFSDDPDLTLGRLRAAVKMHKLTHDGKLDFVIIDYFQLMNPESRKGENRVNELTRLSRGLKLLAKAEKLTVIMLSQMSRAIEQRAENATPKLSDLRESGSIEQDSDQVWFLYSKDPTETHAKTFYLAANRGGRIGEFNLTWLPNYTLFLSQAFEAQEEVA